MPIKAEDYAGHDAVGLARLVAQKEVSADELLDAALARLAAVNPKINALAHNFEALGRAQIKGGLPSGPLAGVPFMTKDLGVMVKGAPLTAGSVAWKGNVATEDSVVTERFRKAGLVIFGSTTSPEYGLTTTTESKAYGATRNPWNLERIAGGSSGGAAAVTAAGVLPMAQASDGGGSIRIPAAMCGLFGLKPSRGRVPMGPRITEGWFGMSTVGAVSRSIRDSAALMDAIAGPELGARLASPAAPVGGFLQALRNAPRNLRIAMWSKTPAGDRVEAEVEQSVADAGKLCESLGHTVEEIAPPFLPESQRAVATIIATCAARDIDVFEQARGRPIGDDELETVTALYRKTALQATAKDLAFAELAMQRQAIATARFMEKYDIILQPVTAKAPIKLGLLTLDDPQRFGREVGSFSPFTALYNLTGQPSMSVPLHWTKDGLPVGVMFTGRFGAEELLFQLAAQLEAAKPWADRRPPL